MEERCLAMLIKASEGNAIGFADELYHMFAELIREGKAGDRFKYDIDCGIICNMEEADNIANIIDGIAEEGICGVGMDGKGKYFVCNW